MLTLSYASAFSHSHSLFLFSFLLPFVSPSLFVSLRPGFSRSISVVRSSAHARVYDETHQRIHQIKNAIIKKRRRLFVEKQACRSDPPAPFSLSLSLSRSLTFTYTLSLPPSRPAYFPTLPRVRSRTSYPFYRLFPRTYIHNWRRSSVYQSLCVDVSHDSSPFSSATFATYVRTYVPYRIVRLGSYPEKNAIDPPSSPGWRETAWCATPGFHHGLNYKTLRNMAPSPPPPSARRKPSVKTMTGWLVV